MRPAFDCFQDAFHMRSLSLYTSLGFDVTDPCVVMSGKPRSGPVDGVEVEAASAIRSRRVR